MFLWCEYFDIDEVVVFSGLLVDGRVVVDEVVVVFEDGAGVVEVVGVVIFGGELVFLGDGIFLGELVFFEVRSFFLFYFFEELVFVSFGVYLFFFVEDDEVDILRFLDFDFVGGIVVVVEVLVAIFSDGNWFIRLSISLVFFIFFMLLRSFCISFFSWYIVLIFFGILLKR